jgi:hypothetical protein
MTVGFVNILFTEKSCEVDVTETSVSTTTEPERTPTTRTVLAGLFKSDWMACRNLSVSAGVHDENLKSRIRNTKDAVNGAAGCACPGAGEVTGVVDELMHNEFDQTHADGNKHCPS